jgi:DNA repair exonuclease SbcCD nuclease subunit
MLISIISDTHFGFKEDSPLEQDCYINFEQALNYAMTNTDLILMPGDLFDLEEPSQKTLHNVFQILSKYIGEQKLIPNTNNKKHLLKPIIAIAGTHEYKGKGYTSPIDVFEKAEYIYQLKHSNIVFKNDELINISGMAGVPEKVAKDVIAKVGFQPIENAINIFMTHQSYNELLAFDDEMVSNLSLEDLPKGFDLYINGHIHKKHLINTTFGPFLIPGSTIITQIKKLEILDNRGFYTFDTITKKLEFVAIPIQRKYFYFEIKEENTTKQELIDKINAKINEIKNEFVLYNDTKLIPVLKVKVSAKLNMNENTNLNEKSFPNEDVILIIDKKLEIHELKNKIENINFEQDKINALENSKKIFEKNLIDAGYKNSIDIDTLITVLKDNNPEKTSQYVLEKIKKDLEL